TCTTATCTTSALPASRSTNWRSTPPTRRPARPSTSATATPRATSTVPSAATRRCPTAITWITWSMATCTTRTATTATTTARWPRRKRRNERAACGLATPRAKPQAARCFVLSSLRRRLLGPHQLGELRLLARRHVGVDDPLGRCLVQLLGRQVVFLQQLRRLARLDHLQHLLDLGLDGLLGDAVAERPLVGLAEVFFSAFGMRHDAFLSGSGGERQCLLKDSNLQPAD